MNAGFCVHEAEVTQALKEARWPQATEPALRDHVRDCATCRELVAVTQAMLQARTNAMQAPRLESPGALWWRADVRRRREAMQRMDQPIRLVERFAFLFALLAAVAAALWQRASVAAAWTWASDVWHSGAFQFSSLWSPAAGASGWMLALVITCVITVAGFGGVAVYLATTRE